MSKYNRRSFQAHPYHLVSPSPWPIFCSGSLLAITTSSTSFFHSFNTSGYVVLSSIMSLVIAMALWFRDISAEGSYEGNHTLAVQKGLNIGMALFIASEAFFFLAIFWAFFHSALSPTIELGAHWPPIEIESINSFELPLLNTVLLLASGTTVTFSHHSLIQGNRSGALYGLMFTVVLAFVFTVLQGLEYTVASYTISDSVYGSCFYFGTGFHGLHVIIGTILLASSLLRLFLYLLTLNHHLGFESSILYWHFVDVVWLALYISVYYWGS